MKYRYKLNRKLRAPQDVFEKRKISDLKFCTEIKGDFGNRSNE
jgi:hypothetical protein